MKTYWIMKIFGGVVHENTSDGRGRFYWVPYC